MKAWIYNDKVCPILPSEADPETMGAIYDITLEDSEALEEAKQLALHAERNLANCHARIVRKLRRNLPSDMCTHSGDCIGKPHNRQFR